MAEMQFRKVREKMSFILSIREAVMAMREGAKATDEALDNYFEVIAPFIMEDEKDKRQKIFELLEAESKKPLAIAPIRAPSRAFRGKKKK